ncbi:ABC transporter ATP-binding protein [Pseudomonas rustica]
MAILKLEGLVKTYGSFRAIDGLSLEVKDGEFVSLLGPSGCGKTTTLQSIAGFVQPTQGRILLDGRDITNVRPEQRGLGIVFQSYALFPHMTVAQNISFGLEMRGVPKPDRAKRITDALDLVRLSGLGDRYPKALSGGQRQRVAIARALAIRPELLLLDEPMSNLDAKLREEMHIELRAIQRDMGITTILVTHDQVEAMTMSDRIAVMQKGRIVQIDTPFEAYERPHSPFASAFLGKTNAFAGAVQKRNDHCCHVQVRDTLLHVPHEDRSLGNDVNVYIRPEKIRLTEPGLGRLNGHIRLRVFLGNLWLIAVDTHMGLVHMTQPNLGTPPPLEGSEVGLNWSDDDLRVLDREIAHGQV